MPAEASVRLNVLVNFAVVNPDTIPGMMVLSFTRRTSSPLTNLDPDMATDALLPIKLEPGDNAEITGGGLITVKASVAFVTEPSIFRSVTLYIPIVRPVSGNEHFTRVDVTELAETVFIVLLFVIVMVAPDLKFVPLMETTHGPVFTPDAGVIFDITRSLIGTSRLNGFVAFGPPGW